MNTIDYLNDLLTKQKEVNLSSSVFRELCSPNPSITIWTNESFLNITSTKDYNSAFYYDKSIIKIAQISDIDRIIEIYSSSIGYVHTYEEIINSLINIFSEKKMIR